MRIRALLTIAILLCAVSPSLGGSDTADTVTHAGWIACQACSHGRVERPESAETPRPPNRECSQKCIREGSPVMFYDESLKKLLRVDNPAATTGQESHRVEVTGTIDAKAGTIHVASLKVLEPYVAKCAMPAEAKKK